MGLTVLICSPGESWREWWKVHGAGRDLVCLSPNETWLGTPGRFSCLRNGVPIWTRFYGSRDPSKSPHVLLSAATEARAAFPEAVFLLPSFRPTPVLTTIFRTLLPTLAPEALLVGAQVLLPSSGWGVRAPIERIELESTLPYVAQESLRKAHWMKLREESSEHRISLQDTMIFNARLGSGTRIPKAELPWAEYGENGGPSLFAVVSGSPEDHEVAAALDHFQATKAHFVAPHEYDGLLCGLARLNGDEIGMGIIEEIDWSTDTIRLRGTAVPPTPIPVLKLGTIRVDRFGRELPELRPWQV